MNRVRAAAGAVVLWAYARTCRRRATTRRLARANILRSLTRRLARANILRSLTAGARQERTVTVDITPDTSRLDRTLSALAVSEARSRDYNERLARYLNHHGHSDLTPEQLAVIDAAYAWDSTRHRVEIPWRNGANHG